jgi:hypothetical protein
MVIRNTPSYTLQFSIDYNQSVLELSGAYNDDYQSVNVYNGETFGADKGYGLTAISKISLNKRGSIRFIQSLTYNRLLAYTFGTKNNVADDGKSSYNCFTGGLGIEYNFTPGHKFKMFVAGEFNASIINGSMDIWFENRYNPPPVTKSYKITNSFRMGFGAMVGSEYMLSNNMGLNIGARFINANVLFKQAEGTNTDTEFPLRDADSPGLDFAGYKNFAFYSIIAGVNFYFGIRDKRYKLN